MNLQPAPHSGAPWACGMCCGLPTAISNRKPVTLPEETNTKETAAPSEPLEQIVGPNAVLPSVAMRWLMYCIGGDMNMDARFPYVRTPTPERRQHIQLTRVA